MKEPVVYRGENYFEDNASICLTIATVKNEKPSIKHSHDFIEIAYVHSGRGHHVIGNDQYAVSKGDLCIINHDFPHAFTPDKKETQEMLIHNCVFMPEFIDYSLLNTNDFKDVAASILFNSFFVEDKPVIRIKLSGADQMEIEELYRKMQIEYFTTPKGYINVLRSLLIEMLTKIFRILECGDTEKRNINSQRADIVKKTLEFLKSNYASAELNMNELAMRTFLSRSYLSKLFKESTGQSLSEYLQNLRISEACVLLKSTDKKIADIMFDVGFKDVKHFNSLFKKITGLTPREYRGTR